MIQQADYLVSAKYVSDAGWMLLVLKLAGRARTCEIALHEQFGTSMNQAVAQIVALIKRAGARPARHLKGTRDEEIQKSQAAKGSRELRPASSLFVVQVTVCLGI